MGGMTFEGAVDGNVLGGLLGEAFGVELTASRVSCAGCSRVAVVADLVVYDAGPGLVGRCRGCGEVMLRVARVRDEVVLDLRGTSLLRVAV
jgi:Family of unknown function (DUF6510)